MFSVSIHATRGWVYSENNSWVNMSLCLCRDNFPSLTFLYLRNLQIHYSRLHLYIILMKRWPDLQFQQSAWKQMLVGKKGNTDVWSQQWVEDWVRFARQFGWAQVAPVSRCVLEAWKKLSALLMQSDGQVSALQQVRRAAVVPSSPRMGI